MWSGREGGTGDHNYNRVLLGGGSSEQNCHLLFLYNFKWFFWISIIIDLNGVNVND